MLTIPTFRWLLPIFMLLWKIKADSQNVRVVCYYTNWSVYRPGTAKFSPQNINPYLCTHLIYAFGGFTKENNFKPFDKYQDIEKGGYAKFTGLKTYNKQLKTLLAVGGWNEGSSRFSPMVASYERRKEFIKNAVKFLRQNHFDGLDLDWEYPSFRDGGKPKDKENYALLVQGLREEFERESEKTRRARLLLTMAVPAGIEYIKKGYDLEKLNKYLDWMNILSYDYHSAFEPSVDHHAPLYSLEEESEYNYNTDLNIHHTVQHYLDNGIDSEKLVLGIPTYGRSYTLYNPEANEMGAPADGPGDMGDATRENGYLAYYEICEKVKSEGWTVVQPNPDAMGPYAYKDNQWVGYDDELIVKKKAEYVTENGLGGIMFWSIDNDDFRGNCHGKAYPLIEAGKEALIAASSNAISVKKPSKSKSSLRNRKTQKRIEDKDENSVVQNSGGRQSSDSTPSPRRRISLLRPKHREEVKGTEEATNKRRSDIFDNRSNSRRKGNRRRPKTTTSTTTVSTTTSTTTPKYYTPEPPTTPDPGGDFKCEDEGFFPHPRDCKKYFWCLSSGPSELGIVAHQFTCPSGLYFNKAADSCDYTQNVLCNTKKKAKTTTTEAPSTTVSTTASTTVRRILTRSTTTTTTPEYDEYEYEDDEDEEDVNTNKNTEEDPRVIKELIELIKKAGGIEQLERQLKLEADGSETVKDSGSTTPSAISKTLYERVLSRSNAAKTEKNTLTYKLLNRNSRGPQTKAIAKEEEEEGGLHYSKSTPKYTTIRRQRPSTQKPEDDKAIDDEDDEYEDEEEEPLDKTPVVETTEAPLVRSNYRRVTTPEYVTIRRSRPTTSSTTTTETSEVEDDIKSFRRSTESSAIDVVSVTAPEYVTVQRRRPSTPATSTTASATASTTADSSTPQYVSIRGKSSTTTPEASTEKEDDDILPNTTLKDESQFTTVTSSLFSSSESGNNIDAEANSVDNVSDNLASSDQSGAEATTTTTPNLHDKQAPAAEKPTSEKPLQESEGVPQLSEPTPFLISRRTRPTTTSTTTAATTTTTPKVSPNLSSTSRLRKRPIKIASPRSSNNSSYNEKPAISLNSLESTDDKIEKDKSIEYESKKALQRRRGGSRFRLQTAESVATHSQNISPNQVDAVEQIRTFRPDITAELADLSSLTAVDIEVTRDLARHHRRRRPTTTATTTTTTTTVRTVEGRSDERKFKRVIGSENKVELKKEKTAIEIEPLPIKRRRLAIKNLDNISDSAGSTSNILPNRRTLERKVNVTVEPTEKKETAKRPLYRSRFYNRRKVTQSTPPSNVVNVTEEAITATPEEIVTENAETENKGTDNLIESNSNLSFSKELPISELPNTKLQIPTDNVNIEKDSSSTESDNPNSSKESPVTELLNTKLIVSTSENVNSENNTSSKKSDNTTKSNSFKTDNEVSNVEQTPKIEFSTTKPRRKVIRRLIHRTTKSPPVLNENHESKSNAILPSSSEHPATVKYETTTTSTTTSTATEEIKSVSSTEGTDFTPVSNIESILASSDNSSTPIKDQEKAKEGIDVVEDDEKIFSNQTDDKDDSANASEEEEDENIKLSETIISESKNTDFNRNNFFGISDSKASQFGKEFVKKANEKNRFDEIYIQDRETSTEAEEFSIPRTVSYKTVATESSSTVDPVSSTASYINKAPKKVIRRLRLHNRFTPSTSFSPEVTSETSVLDTDDKVESSSKKYIKRPSFFLRSKQTNGGKRNNLLFGSINKLSTTEATTKADLFKKYSRRPYLSFQKTQKTTEGNFERVTTITPTSTSTPAIPMTYSQTTTEIVNTVSPFESSTESINQMFELDLTTSENIRENDITTSIFNEDISYTSTAAPTEYIFTTTNINEIESATEAKLEDKKAKQIQSPSVTEIFDVDTYLTTTAYVEDTTIWNKGSLQRDEVGVTTVPYSDELENSFTTTEIHDDVIPTFSTQDEKIQKEEITNIKIIDEIFKEENYDTMNEKGNDNIEEGRDNLDNETKLNKDEQEEKSKVKVNNDSENVKDSEVVKDDGINGEKKQESNADDDKANEDVDKESSEYEPDNISIKENEQEKESKVEDEGNENIDKASNKNEQDNTDIKDVEQEQESKLKDDEDSGSVDKENGENEKDISGDKEEVEEETETKTEKTTEPNIIATENTKKRFFRPSLLRPKLRFTQKTKPPLVLQISNEDRNKLYDKEPQFKIYHSRYGGKAETSLISTEGTPKFEINIIPDHPDETEKVKESDDFPVDTLEKDEEIEAKPSSTEQTIPRSSFRPSFTRKPAHNFKSRVTSSSTTTESSSTTAKNTLKVLNVRNKFLSSNSRKYKHPFHKSEQHTTEVHSETAVEVVSGIPTPTEVTYPSTTPAVTTEPAIIETTMTTTTTTTTQAVPLQPIVTSNPTITEDSVNETVTFHPDVTTNPTILDTTTNQTISFHHVFEQNENVTTPSMDKLNETIANEVAPAEKLEKLIEVNRIVKVSLKGAKDDNSEEKEVTLLPSVDKIGVISRLTVVNVVDGTSNYSNVSVPVNNPQNLHSQLSFVPVLPTETIDQNQSNDIRIESKSEVNTFTAKPPLIVESATIPLEGLFNYKLYKDIEESAQEEESLDTENSQRVSVRIIQPKASLREEKKIQPYPLTHPINLIHENGALRAKVVEVMPEMNSGMIRIAPIEVSLEGKVPSQINSSQKSSEVTVANTPFVSYSHAGINKVDIKVLSSENTTVT